MLDSEVVTTLDSKFANHIRNHAMGGDKEEDHILADELLCELLEALGCTETVAAFKSVGKWYA